MKAAALALVAAVAVPATEIRVAAPLVAPPEALRAPRIPVAVTPPAVVALGAPPAAVALAVTRAVAVTLAVVETLAVAVIQETAHLVTEVIKVGGTMATIMARATTTETAMETTVTAMTLTETTVPIPVEATMGIAAMPTAPIREAAIMEAKDTAATNKRIA